MEIKQLKSGFYNGEFNRMTKEKLLMIAERNLKKAQIAFEHNYNRTGITEQEKENLTNNVEYNRIVYNLIMRGTEY